MLDAIRDGLINKAKADVPNDLAERQNHLKAFGYFSDVAMAGTCALSPNMLLDQPFRNPDIDHLAHKLRTSQTKTLASGVDMIMADLRDAMNAPPQEIDHHQHALVFIIEHPPRPMAE